jgi:hypothetical protein
MKKMTEMSPKDGTSRNKNQAANQRSSTLNVDKLGQSKQVPQIKSSTIF